MDRPGAIIEDWHYSSINPLRFCDTESRKKEENTGDEMLEPVADWEQSEANYEKLRAKKKRKQDSKQLTMNLSIQSKK